MHTEPEAPDDNVRMETGGTCPSAPAFLVCEQKHCLHVAKEALPTSLLEWPGSPDVSDAGPGAKGLKPPPSSSPDTAYS